MHYDVSSIEELRYAACTPPCTSAGNWVDGAIAQLGPSSFLTSLTVDQTGHLHLGYYAPASGAFKYATCGTDCSTASNWTAVRVDQLSEPGYGGDGTSLVVDVYGRLHVSYHDAFVGLLKYATCADSCDVATNWRTTVADSTFAVGYFSSLVVGPSGRVHVSYRSNMGTIRYIE